MVYGLWIAALCLSAFVFVIYGPGMDGLGENCNEAFSDRCTVVFRARATTFACLTWFSLFLAWEVVDTRVSLFCLNRKNQPRFWNVLYNNKFLFFSVSLGFFTIFPVLYIPVINHEVFRHSGIKWEWVIVFIATAFFFAGIESWKLAKRVYFRHSESKAAPESEKLAMEADSQKSQEV
jgi:Na+-exporting ATPase